MFAGLGLIVRRIRIRDRAPYQPFFYALPQYPVEDLLRDMVAPEPPAPVPADRRGLRRLLRQLQPTKPLYAMSWSISLSGRACDLVPCGYPTGSIGNGTAASLFA